VSRQGGWEITPVILTGVHFFVYMLFPLPQNLTDGHNFFSRPIVFSVLPGSEWIDGSADEPSLLSQDFADLEKKSLCCHPHPNCPRDDFRPTRFLWGNV
jgi:hypothetical protein